MIANGSASLYFVEESREVTNLSGSLRFPIIAGTIRLSATHISFLFIGPDHYVWHGRCRAGELSQAAYCRNTREPARICDLPLNL